MTLLQSRIVKNEDLSLDENIIEMFFSNYTPSPNAHRDTTLLLACIKTMFEMREKGNPYDPIVPRVITLSIVSDFGMSINFLNGLVSDALMIFKYRDEKLSVFLNNRKKDNTFDIKVPDVGNFPTELLQDMGTFVALYKQERKKKNG